MDASVTEFLQVLKDVGAQITSATPEILLGLFSIMVGYCIKSVKQVPRKLIPVCVIVFCAIVYPWLVEDNFKASFHMAHPQVRIVVLGAVIGFVAWAIHYIFLRPLIDKFAPKLFGEADDSEAPPTTQPPK